jgi:hypothetical protein
VGWTYRGRDVAAEGVLLCKVNTSWRMGAGERAGLREMGQVSDSGFRAARLVDLRTLFPLPSPEYSWLARSYEGQSMINERAACTWQARLVLSCVRLS